MPGRGRSAPELSTLRGRSPTDAVRSCRRGDRHTGNSGEQVGQTIQHCYGSDRIRYAVPRLRRPFADLDGDVVRAGEGPEAVLVCDVVPEVDRRGGSQFVGQAPEGG